MLYISKIISNEEKNLIILTLIPILIISCETTTLYDQETADVITQFYGDALGERESYNLLRDLSKDIGEGNNIASKHPEVVKEIELAMKESHVESSIFPFIK